MPACSYKEESVVPSPPQYPEKHEFKEGVEKHEFNEGVENKKETVSRKTCCSLLCFLDVKEAQGFAILGTIRGIIVMSNIFLSTALLSLAQEDAGCDPEEDCWNEIYGFRPSSLLTVMSTASGILSALLMPIIGAMIDYTPHRRNLGICTSCLITIIQTFQIYTVEKTWLLMSVLQTIAGFLYNIQVLTSYSYLPEIGRMVDEETMSNFSTNFTVIRYSMQLLFLIFIIYIGSIHALNDLYLSHVTQSITVFMLIIGFPIGWKLLPSRPQRRRLKGANIVLAGFIQNWNTFKGIQQHYSRGLLLFLFGISFTQSAANAFTTVSVTYLVEVLSMDSTEVGIVWFLALLFTVPGAKIGGFVSIKTDPLISFKIILFIFSLTTVISAFVLTDATRSNLAYLFACLWGTCLGWYYPLSNLIFSLSLPKGQESELTGFFMCSTQIIVWLPPLVVTILNENGIHMKWGLMSIKLYFLIGLLFIQSMESWDSVRNQVTTNKIIAEDEELEKVIA